MAWISSPPNVVAFMLDLCSNKGRTLEPSAGDGAFFNELKSRQADCVGIEVDPSVAPEGALVRDFFDFPLTEMRADIDALRDQVDAEQRARVETVSRSIESMKPASAAKIVEALDLPLATEVVRTMAKSKSGKLLAAMSPSFAARIAERLTHPTRTEAPAAPPKP